MFSFRYVITALCAAGAVFAKESHDVPVEEAPSIITALFTDGNNRDSRADFTPGKWEFDGCAANPIPPSSAFSAATSLMDTDQCNVAGAVAPWPIHRIKQHGIPAQCTYRGSEGGSFQIFGSGLRHQPPVHPLSTTLTCTWDVQHQWEGLEHPVDRPNPEPLAEIVSTPSQQHRTVSTDHSIVLAGTPTLGTPKGIFSVVDSEAAFADAVDTVVLKGLKYRTARMIPCTIIRGNALA
ncbi:uncharacterized protein B0I36DRAFT_354305 [Microdochium trichocladiopsis]|uniref:Uncharacterized protein n=1 Tax=Microdochium trichocladiopsis TaxID=1682393 RepID=A0A9P8XU74_9PEZI|nr:uncharacterized protein B0I36DRAFT_354305 [Microdochium trichocladiopsis]KAH7017980.1 hypothetical protein B0I36DRAFT_354305 [Microdochium trichocladiopsis]